MLARRRRPPWSPRSPPSPQVAATASWTRTCAQDDRRTIAQGTRSTAARTHVLAAPDARTHTRTQRNISTAGVHTHAAAVDAHARAMTLCLRPTTTRAHASRRPATFLLPHHRRHTPATTTSRASDEPALMPIVGAPPSRSSEHEQSTAELRRGGHRRSRTSGDPPAKSSSAIDALHLPQAH